MEKRSKSISDRIKPVRLYLDDVEAIVDVMKEAGEGEVTITTADHILRSVDELERYGEGTVLTDVEISRHGPHISVDLQPGGAWLWSGKDDPVSTGVFEKVRLIVRGRRRWLGRLVSDSTWAFLSVLGLANAGTLVSLYFNLYAAFLVWAFALVWLVAQFHMGMHRGAVLVPARKRDAPSFFRRNSDRLIIAALSVVAGGLLGWGLSNL